MRQIRRFIWLLLAIFCLWCWPQPSHAQGNGHIQLQDMKLAIKETPTLRQPVTDLPVELIGPEQEMTFYYEIFSPTTSSDNKLVLHVKHSELLIAPSSITIRIDEEAVMSKPLDGEQVTQQIVLPLTGKSLEKGVHSVTVSFHGVMKEGICVDQETPGNWLTIGIDSYFQLNGQEHNEAPSLANYPRKFIGTTKHPVFVVLPDNASMATLNSGMSVAAYLAERSDFEGAVQVVRESGVKLISGNVIFLGAKTEFTTPFMKKIMQQAKLPAEQQSLILSSHMLIEGGQQAEALIVTAHSPEELEKRLPILVNEQFMKQVAGQQMSIQTIPEIAQDNDKRMVSLKKFSMPNLTLDRLNGESPYFYSYVPVALQKDQSPTLELHVKRSETIGPLEEGSIEGDVELTVLVNKVPHSVNIRALTDHENGLYTVHVPIDASAIGENRLISLQFTSSGLRKKNPCVSTDDDRWIYIADDSFFTFPTAKSPDITTLAGFPSPFIDGANETIVVLPDEKTVDDAQLLHLYRSMRVGGYSPQWTLKMAKGLTADDVKDHHVIFIGGIGAQPLLRAVQSDLTVSYEQGNPNLQPFGFLQEAVEMTSWIQPSPWSKEPYAILVFDRMNDTTNYVDKAMLDFIKSTTEMSTVAVKATNQQLYTNASQIEKTVEKLKDAQSSNDNSASSVWWIAGFVALLILVLVVLLFIHRKRKDRNHKGK